MIRLTFTVFLFVVFSHLSFAQKVADKMSCDLTYSSIMQQNKVDKVEWVQRWFTTYNKSPAISWMLRRKDDPIVSWVLIEHPNFHAAERTTLWLFRTKSRAYYWSSVQADWHSVSEIEKRAEKLEITPKLHDSFFETIFTWKQAEVLKPKQPIDGFSPEFWGFLTIFSGDSCKQMLLGWDDFMICPTEECGPGPERLGRVMQALSPIFEEIRTKHYGRSK